MLNKEQRNILRVLNAGGQITTSKYTTGGVLTDRQGFQWNIHNSTMKTLVSQKYIRVEQTLGDFQQWTIDTAGAVALGIR